MGVKHKIEQNTKHKSSTVFFQSNLRLNQSRVSYYTCRLYALFFRLFLVFNIKTLSTSNRKMWLSVIFQNTILK